MGSIFVSVVFHSFLLYMASLIVIESNLKAERLLEIELLPVEQKEQKIASPIKIPPKRERPKRIGREKRVFIPERKVATVPKIKETVKIVAGPIDHQPAPKSVPIVSETAGDILTGTLTGVETDNPGTGIPSFEVASSIKVEVSGEVTERPVLYQKGFKIPEWVEKKGFSLTGEFRFWVLPDGSVDRVSVNRSFGYPSLDSLASSAILKWRFQSLPKNISYREEWGVAGIKIRLK
ncbi:MAG: TonB family protein [bacterium]|nr:TonB family protein [bacterium]